MTVFVTFHEQFVIVIRKQTKNQSSTKYEADIVWLWTFQLNNAIEWHCAVYRAKPPSEMCPTRSKIIRRSPRTIKVLFSLTSDKAAGTTPHSFEANCYNNSQYLYTILYIYYSTYDSPQTHEMSKPTLGQTYSFYDDL